MMCPDDPSSNVPPKTIAAAPPSGIDSRLITKMSRFWQVTKNNPDIFVTSECSRDIFVTFVLDCPENVPNLVNSEREEPLLANLERKSVTECSKKVTLRFCYVTEVWMVGFRIVTMSGQRTRLP